MHVSLYNLALVLSSLLTLACPSIHPFTTFCSILLHARPATGQLGQVNYTWALPPKRAHQVARVGEKGDIKPQWRMNLAGGMGTVGSEGKREPKQS